MDKIKKFLAKKRTKRIIGMSGAAIVILAIAGVMLFGYDAFLDKVQRSGEIKSISALGSVTPTISRVERISFAEMQMMNGIQTTVAAAGSEDGLPEDSYVASNDDTGEADSRTEGGVQLSLDNEQRQKIRDQVESDSNDYKLNEEKKMTFTVNTPIPGVTVNSAVNGGRDNTATQAQIAKSKYLGQFVVTAYCPCMECCGKTDGITASGVKAQANHTIATSSSYAFGTKMILNGRIYTVEDRGGAIQGNRIDIFFNTHQEALNFGRQTMDVYLYTE